MLRVAEGGFLRNRDPFVLLFILLVVLSLRSGSVFPSLDVTADTRNVETNPETFILANLVDSPKLSEESEDRFNITFWIRDWNEKIAFADMNVTVYDLKRRLASSHISDETGHLDLRFVYAGSYVVLVESENRTVCYQKFDVEESDTYVVRTWAYDLDVTFVDESGQALANHTVLLYDQTVFQASNYTLLTDDLKRDANHAVMTDEAGRLVHQTETDEKGMVSFTGIWNGTYRMKIISKESWIGEYILGEYVLTYQAPVSGDYVLDLQEPASLSLECVKADLALKSVTASNAPIVNVTIQVRNKLGHLFFEDSTNKTGFAEQKNVYLIDREYAISALCGNRLVGYSVIDAATTRTFTIECWAYDLTVVCLDRKDKPLQDHIVFLYDQLVFYSPTNFTAVDDQKGALTRWNETCEGGMAYFRDVWNGTYRILVAAGELIGEETINLQKPETIDVKCNKTSLTISFITGSDEPLPNATVYMHDSDGRLIFRDYTDQNGYIQHESVYVDNYRVFVEWMGIEVWSGDLDVLQDTDPKIRCSVFRLEMNFRDPFGNALPKADVTLRKKISIGATSWRYMEPALKLETNENGLISRLLPSGIYEALCSSGVYSGSATINLVSNHEEIVRCNMQLNILFLALFVASPLAGLTLLLERRKLRKPIEIRRYKSMLSNLESMYRSGQVEYRLYRKVREEYEAKLMELGGREMR